MKSGHTIQLLLSWMITWISAKFQALGMLLLCLLFLMFIDYITGMLASRKEGIEKDFGELSKKPDAGWLLPVLFP